MIGTKIRTYRHLMRSVGNKATRILVSVGVGNYISGEAVSVVDTKTKNSVILLFQEYYNSHDMSDIRRRFGNSVEVDSLSYKYRSCAVINSSNALRGLQCNIILLPDSFIEMYSEFTKNNRKLLEPLFEKYGISNEKNMSFFFYTLCHESPNLFAWAIKSFYGNRININYITRILYWSIRYNQLANKLQKGTITAYNSRDQILYLLHEIRILRRNKRANDMINIFNTNQKKLLKSIELSERQYNILGKFGRISKVKQVNFVRKMSTIDNVDEIFRQMAFLVDVHFEWNKASLLEYVANTDGILSDIVIDSDTFVLLRVKNYETIKRIAKNTNWCISKNKRYWNDYIDNKCGDAIQYILCDFTKKEDDKLSIVGFTVTSNRGITSAHNFVNDNLLSGDGNCRPMQIKKIISSVDGIDSLLKSKNISLSQLMSYDEPSYEWNKDSFIAHLKTCVTEENIIIYYDENNRMVLSVNDNNARYIFNENYNNIEGFDREYGNDEEDKLHFLFLDFNKSKDDKSHLKFCIIYPNENGVDTSYSYVYDELCQPCIDTFDSLIDEYQLPYTIIPRVNNNITRIIRAIRNYDVTTIKKLIGLEDVRNTLMLKEPETSSLIYEALNWSLCNYHSLDMLKVIYESGLTLSLIMVSNHVTVLAHNLIRGFNFRRGRVYPRFANDEQLEAFNQGKIKDESLCLSIGIFSALKMLLDNEPFMVVYERIGKRLGEIADSDLLGYFLELAIDELNFNQDNDMTINFVQIAPRLKRQDLIERLFNKDINNYNVIASLLNNLNHGNEFFNRFQSKAEQLRHDMPRKKKKSVENLFEEFAIKSS